MERTPVIPIKWHLYFWFGLIIVGVAALSPYYINLYKATMHRLVFLPVWFIATYGNLYFLLPKLWDKGMKWFYSLALILLIGGLTVIQRIVCIHYIYPKYFWMRAPNVDELNPFWLGPFIQFAAFISLPIILSIGFREGWKWYQESYKAKQIIAEQQAAELSYLKAQVNPHFLFNTLNNLYGLSLESSKKVPGMILKLSDLLSFSLYESKVASIQIAKELELIHDFISLEKERYEDRVLVHINIEDSVVLEKHIAPLLLLPLVENSFKHGIKNTDQLEPIEMSLHQVGNELHFTIKNHIAHSGNDSSEIGGLGLSNLRRRLELRYPSHHSLEVKSDDEFFVVNLQIHLDE